MSKDQKPSSVAAAPKEANPNCNKFFIVSQSTRRLSFFYSLSSSTVAAAAAGRGLVRSYCFQETPETRAATVRLDCRAAGEDVTKCTGAYVTINDDDDYQVRRALEVVPTRKAL